MIFSPVYKKRRLPTDRRALIRITSVINRKRKIYVIFFRMERPCNPQLNYRTVIKIYPMFPGPNFRLFLHPLWSPSTKENLWTVYRQPPYIWESIGGNILFFFPKYPNSDRSGRKKRRLISVRFFLKPQIYSQHRKHFLHNRGYLGLSLTFFGDYSHGYLPLYVNKTNSPHARPDP